MLDSYTDILQSILRRGGEVDDGTSEWQQDAEEGIVAKFRELWARHAWLCLRKYPAATILTAAKITGLTLTVSGGSSAGSLSAAPAGAVSILDYIVIPNGRDYYLRVTAHTGGSSVVTLDGAPEDLAAVPVIIAKHEYDLPSDFGIFSDSAIYTHLGGKILVIREEDLRRDYPRPQEGWPATYAARIGKRKVAFSSYPSLRQRLEVPYNREPADPSGSTTLVLDAHLRPVLADGALSYLYEAKQDKRLATAEQRYEKGLLIAAGYETMLKGGQGTEANERRQPVYRGA